MNETRIENEFICINSAYCVKVGNVEVSDNKAGYVIEVLDWTGDGIDTVLKDMRSLNGVKSAFLSMADEQGAVIISDRQFHQEAMLQLLKLAETTDIKEGNVKLSFQLNEDRRALFVYLITKRQEALQAQQQQQTVSDSSSQKDVTPELSVVGNG